MFTDTHKCCSLPWELEHHGGVPGVLLIDVQIWEALQLFRAELKVELNVLSDVFRVGWFGQDTCQCYISEFLHTFSPSYIFLHIVHTFYLLTHVVRVGWFNKTPDNDVPMITNMFNKSAHHYFSCEEYVPIKSITLCTREMDSSPSLA